MTELIQDNDTVDNAVDLEIQSCLTLEHLRSFFLFAGAGSGKTRSLVNAINYLRSKDDPSRTNRNWLQVRGKQVAVITFTNAARDEIIERTERDPLVLVCTIHSFAWSLIQDFQEDIRDWLRGDLEFSIAEMVAAQGKRTRTNTKVYADTERSIQSKTRRLARLDGVQVFNYSPSGESSGRDSLNHSEVLKIVSNFLENHQTMRQVLVDRFPVLLVDESQDTNRHLMDALFTVAKANEGNFCLGLLGDMMQRIYADGKVGLGAEGSIPTTWAQPSKKMNHRSGKRIVQLINQIRSADDKQTQTPRTDRPDSIVRLFVVDRKSSDTRAMEQMVAK
ncbi:MAG: UvrD-helicase domain-containing protein, partial [Pseudoruegeria sp.]